MLQKQQMAAHQYNLFGFMYENVQAQYNWKINNPYLLEPKLMRVYCITLISSITLQKQMSSFVGRWLFCLACCSHHQFVKLMNLLVPELVYIIHGQWFSQEFSCFWTMQAKLLCQIYSVVLF